MNPHEDLILLPLIVLVLWTLFISLWMFVTRVGAMTSQKMDPDLAKHPRDIQGQLPSTVRAIGDNYNNLFELPVVFYATTLAIYAIGHVDMLHIYLAWGFVGARILHSLIQTTYNKVIHRFSVFVIGLICVIAMALRELLALI